jgi:hypothetical protein
MSLNPDAYAYDRRATRLRVTLRSWVVESPAHCDRVRRDYTKKSPSVKHTFRPARRDALGMILSPVLCVLLTRPDDVDSHHARPIWR